MQAKYNRIIVDYPNNSSEQPICFIQTTQLIHPNN